MVNLRGIGFFNKAFIIFSVFSTCVFSELRSKCYKFKNSNFFKIETVEKSFIKQGLFSLSMTRQSKQGKAEAFIVFFFQNKESLAEYQSEFTLSGFPNKYESFRNFFFFNFDFEEKIKEEYSEDNMYLLDLYKNLYGSEFWNNSFYKYCYSDHCVEHLGTASLSIPDTFMDTFSYKGKKKVILSSPDFVKIRELKMEKIYRTYETVISDSKGSLFILVYSIAEPRTRDGLTTLEFKRKRFPEAKKWFQTFEETSSCNIE